MIVSNNSVTYGYDSYYDGFEFGSDRFIFEPSFNLPDKSFRAGFKFRFGESRDFEPRFNNNDYTGIYDLENSFQLGAAYHFETFLLVGLVVFFVLVGLQF